MSLESAGAGHREVKSNSGTSRGGRGGESCEGGGRALPGRSKGVPLPLQIWAHTGKEWLLLRHGVCLFVCAAHAARTMPQPNGSMRKVGQLTWLACEGRQPAAPTDARSSVPGWIVPPTLSRDPSHAHGVLLPFFAPDGSTVPRELVRACYPLPMTWRERAASQIGRSSPAATARGEHDGQPTPQYDMRPVSWYKPSTKLWENRSTHTQATEVFVPTEVSRLFVPAPTAVSSCPCAPPCTIAPVQLHRRCSWAVHA